MAQLADITQFNTHVSLGVALAQRILNLMPHWQDRFDARVELNSDATPARFL